MTTMSATAACSASAALAGKLVQEKQRALEKEEQSPSTAPELDDDDACSEAESTSSRSSSCASSPEEADEAAPRQLQAGIYHPPAASVPTATPSQPVQQKRAEAPPAAQAPEGAAPTATKFEKEETFFIFDWDDTVLPSSWVNRQGLRLDAGSTVSAVQRDVLGEVAVAAGKTLRAARQHGTVILVTNAERGWIELSCQKFLPTLSPMLENVKMVSARTSYEGPQNPSPLDWKLRAFEDEIERYFGAPALQDPSTRKNVLSLGDSVHEREALQRASSSLCNCRSKSLKFVERPDVSQICKQHELIASSFDNIVNHDGNLDLCLRCP